MACTVCLGVCLLGWVVGRSLWCLILFLYVNRFKWHMFEVPTRRSVSGYIITAHRCLCIHGCYWFSRAISHILTAWKESTNIRIHGHQHLLNRYDIFTNHLFCMYLSHDLFPSIHVNMTTLQGKKTPCWVVSLMSR